MTSKQVREEISIKAICEDCAKKYSQLDKPMVDYILGEPCADCGVFKPTCFTDHFIRLEKN